MGIQLNVIVVGGGIRGLATAVGLKRSGHNVTIYKRYVRNTEQGAGLIISANAHRIFKQWDLDPAANGMRLYRKALIVDGKTATIILDRKVHLEVEAADEYRITTTRQDLRQMLRSEALRSSNDGEGTVEIFYDSKVVEYDPVRPAVKFANGMWKTADLVVACDRIEFRAAKCVTGKESPAGSNWTIDISTGNTNT